MANRRGMTRRCGISLEFRSGSVGRRAHAKLDRAIDDHECLPLAVDIPAAATPLLDLRQFGFGDLELLLLPPLPQGPFRRPVDAGIRVVAIEVEQLAEQRLPLAGGKSIDRRTCPRPGSTPAASRSPGGTGWRPFSADPASARALAPRIVSVELGGDRPWVGAQGT